MGIILSTISYYRKSLSQQNLDDYINENNDCKFDKDTHHEDNNNNININSTEYYILNIYVNEDLSSSIINLYKKNAEKHNTNVNNYLSNNHKKESLVYCYDAGFDLLNPTTLNLINNSTNNNQNIKDNQDNPFIYENVNIINIKNNITLDHKVKCSMTYNNKFVCYYLYSRSSTPIKTPLRLANNVGIIDSGYRGNIKAYFDINKNFYNNNTLLEDYNNLSTSSKLLRAKELFELQESNRYTQICPPNIDKPMKIQILTFNDLNINTTRSTNGFGSTGN